MGSRLSIIGDSYDMGVAYHRRMISAGIPSVLHVGIGDACLEIVVHDETWLGAASALPAAAQSLVIGQIVCGGPFPSIPTGRPDFDDGDARGWIQRPVPFVVMGAAQVLIGDRVVTMTAEPGRGAEAFDRALPLTLTWLLGAVDRWVIHAAAVVAPDGRAVVAVGPGGAGKSTVAAAALGAGWPVLADDLVVLRLGPEGLEVCGVPRPLAVPSEFSGLGPAIVGDPRRRRRISGALTDGWWPIGRLAVLAHGETGSTTVRALDAMEAFRPVRTAHFAADVPSRMAGWFPIAGRLARLPTVRLALGTRDEVRLASTIEALAPLADLTATANHPPPR
jgi:hypothetical protein